MLYTCKSLCAAAAHASMSDMAEGIAKHTEQNIFGAADPSREAAKNARRIVVKVCKIPQEPHRLPRYTRPAQGQPNCEGAAVFCTFQQSLQPP